MLRAAKRYNVNYTASIIHTYWEDVTPPFSNPIDEERYSLIAYGREIIKSGGEMGIHGYNHHALQMDEDVGAFFNSQAWASPVHMQASIAEVLTYFNSAFPSYIPMSYVPPSDVLSMEGREALRLAWPELAVISSSYNTDEYGRTYVQEYEVKDDGIVELPRVTRGYSETEMGRWREANVMTSLGVFSHSLHPNEWLESAENGGRTWEQQYEDLTEWLIRVDAAYPWLRESTAMEAGYAVMNTQYSDVNITQSDDGLYGNVEHYTEPLYYILRTERPVRRQSHCNVRKIDENIYLVKVTGPSFAIGLGR